jgi:hypothetical protein
MRDPDFSPGLIIALAALGVAILGYSAIWLFWT